MTIEELVDIATGIETERPEPKLAFLVVGPEGSGGYMLTEALVAAGCYWEQDFQNIKINQKSKLYWDNQPTPFVVHRSLPHAGQWPKLISFIENFGIWGLKWHCLFILRDFYATAKSVFNRKVKSNQEWGSYNLALANQIKAMEYLGEIIGQTTSSVDDFTYITYEAFTTSEGFRRWLFEERLQLPYPADYNVENRNLKYYAQEEN